MCLFQMVKSKLIVEIVSTTMDDVVFDRSHRVAATEKKIIQGPKRVHLRVARVVDGAFAVRLEREVDWACLCEHFQKQPCRVVCRVYGALGWFSVGNEKLQTSATAFPLVSRDLRTRHCPGLTYPRVSPVDALSRSSLRTGRS